MLLPVMLSLKSRKLIGSLNLQLTIAQYVLFVCLIPVVCGRTSRLSMWPGFGTNILNAIISRPGCSKGGSVHPPPQEVPGVL